jgi:hypothetical protein
MPGLHQIQDMLERELGTQMPYHNYFWRGKTRDELVAAQVFGLTLVVPGRAEESNLLRAMKGSLANDGSANPVGVSLLRALFRQARFSERDVALLEAWISELPGGPLQGKAYNCRGEGAGPGCERRYTRSVLAGH